jgi:4-hydroxy-tetrahydrodipicolinate synthase
MSTMVQQAAFGQVDEARLTHQALAHLTALLFREGNPAGIKTVLNHLGLMEPHVRLPLVEASKGLRDELYAALANLNVETA